MPASASGRSPLRRGAPAPPTPGSASPRGVPRRLAGGARTSKRSRRCCVKQREAAKARSCAARRAARGRGGGRARLGRRGARVRGRELDQAAWSDAQCLQRWPSSRRARAAGAGDGDVRRARRGRAARARGCARERRQGGGGGGVRGGAAAAVTDADSSRTARSRASARSRRCCVLVVPGERGGRATFADVGCARAARSWPPLLPRGLRASGGRAAGGAAAAGARAVEPSEADAGRPGVGVELLPSWSTRPSSRARRSRARRFRGRRRRRRRRRRSRLRPPRDARGSRSAAAVEAHSDALCDGGGRALGGGGRRSSSVCFGDALLHAFLDRAAASMRAGAALVTLRLPDEGARARARRARRVPARAVLHELGHSIGHAVPRRRAAPAPVSFRGRRRRRAARAARGARGPRAAPRRGRNNAAPRPHPADAGDAEAARDRGTANARPPRPRGRAARVGGRRGVEPRGRVRASSTARRFL